MIIVHPSFCNVKIAHRQLCECGNGYCADLVKENIDHEVGNFLMKVMQSRTYVANILTGTDTCSHFLIIDEVEYDSILVDVYNRSKVRSWKISSSEIDYNCAVLILLKNLGYNVPDSRWFAEFMGRRENFE